MVHVRNLHLPPSRWTKSSNFTRREKNHSLFHWNTLTSPELLTRIWMSSKRNASITTGISMGQEICLTLGQVSLNVTRKQVKSRPDYIWPELWTKLGRNAQLKERQKWSNEKIHLDNARKLRGIYFIDPEDKEFKETIKNARNKLETPVAPALPCKMIKNNQHAVTSMRLKQNLRVFWKPVNLQDCVWENLYRIIMKAMLQEKETLHCSITIWFTNLFLCLKPWKFPQQTQQWTRNGKMWKRFRRGTWRKSEVTSDRWSKDEGCKSSFCLTDGHMSSEKCWIGDKAPKIQTSSCTPRWYCKRWFWILCSIHRTRIISITNDSSKGHWCHIQTARVRRPG